MWTVTQATLVSRAVWGANFINQNNTDENGHGTHVAGTIGGLTLGISPHTRLVALKVFDGNAQGPWSGVLSALDWACTDAENRNATALSVINMSLGGDRYDVIDDAVSAAVRRGLTVVVAAGNENQNVSNVSPAACPEAIAVGATDQNDNKPWWSNWGPDLDVFAPGDGILSSWFATDEATLTLSGTSMASPHVAGLCAYFMEVYGPHTPAQMRQRVVGYATQGRVQNAGQGSPNMLVFNGNALEYGQK
ncbi:peptidase S8/S53 domain-containing protein [Diplogelasinospora grovesii]|uniref:Peptidase S8/S53 domain-containing protein n=1 Tax=Diplogelasinospora grovesii TaxID=303347 RepID=A0AAN6MYG6_9PEZI|nr:peptidase S8/S53 domain-containing protein [Diplogelasinospora grovesii]